MTKFSVFLPVYNGWPFVKQCVESILNQTYVDFQLHVLDNCSSDETVAWIESLHDARIEIHKSDRVLSIEENWGRILHVKKNMFMTMIGHDDVFDSKFLETIKGLIDANPKSILYKTGGKFINGKGKTIRSCRSTPEKESAANYLKSRLSFERDVFGTGYVMKSDAYDRIGGIPKFEKLFFADDALWLSLINDKNLVSCSDELFSIRLHLGSESASTPSSWSHILKGLRQFSAFLNSYGESNLQAKSVINKKLPSFMLKYHENAYIYALIDASRQRKTISEETLRTILSSLECCSPGMGLDVLRSRKIKIIEHMNASIFRKLIPKLWNMYYVFKNI